MSNIGSEDTDPDGGADISGADAAGADVGGSADPRADPRVRVIRTGGKLTQEQALARLDRRIEIRFGQGEISYRHQLMALALVELLSRLFPFTSVICRPELRAHAALPPGDRLLTARIADARSHGHPADGRTVSDAPPLTITVGAAGDQADVHVDGNAWQSYVGTHPSLLAEGELSLLPIGPLCAAARGAAQVLQLVFADTLSHVAPIESCYSSALAYDASSMPLDDPDLPMPSSLDAALVGVGSVGGAAVYLLARMPFLSGSIALIDDQTLESRNYVRAILAEYELAGAEAVKVEVAAVALAHHKSLRCEPEQMTVAEYVALRSPDASLPLIGCAVDSIASRRSIQDLMPLEIVNAACSDVGVLVSGHRTDDGPCLYCMYLGQVLDREGILIRRIARATGLFEKQVAFMLVRKAPLDQALLRRIARHRDAEADVDAYAAFAGSLLIDLYRQELSYGEMRLAGDAGGQVVVASPFVTALAGFLLAAELLKAGTPGLHRYRLGATGALTTPEGARPAQYDERLLASPENALLNPVPRWTTLACLCRSERRLDLMRPRYALRFDEGGLR
jgi:hypothetical protein